MSAKPPPIAAPIEIAKWFKTRRHDIVTAVSLSSHEGVNIVNVREYLIGSDGCMRPTTKGIAMSVRRLPELSRALRLALEKARALDLLPDEGGGEQ
jgi:hypothetical protein